jgi:hypothetical protein
MKVEVTCYNVFGLFAIWWLGSVLWGVAGLLDDNDDDEILWPYVSAFGAIVAMLVISLAKNNTCRLSGVIGCLIFSFPLILVVVAIICSYVFMFTYGMAYVLTKW